MGASCIVLMKDGGHKWNGDLPSIPQGKCPRSHWSFEPCLAFSTLFALVERMTPFFFFFLLNFKTWNLAIGIIFALKCMALLRNTQMWKEKGVGNSAFMDIHGERLI